MPVLLVGMGENAGVVDVGDGWAATFKIESHNHPSYVEPYQGAATGVGGIVRDILTMGARPVAVLDALRFGPADAPDTARVLPGVVAGVGGYGNCLGLPNIGGETVFDASYLANPLVNALCVGVLRKEEIKLARAEGPGSRVVLFGARTGGDGIGGASVLASANFEERSQRKRPSVQVGDRSPRRCSSSAAWRSSLPTSSQASRISARPDCPARRRNSRRRDRAGWTSNSTWCRCATRRSRPKRSS
jgi:phosphoribosylformylglycinamidine synthase